MPDCQKPTAPQWKDAEIGVDDFRIDRRKLVVGTQCNHKTTLLALWATLAISLSLNIALITTPWLSKVHPNVTVSQDFKARTSIVERKALAPTIYSSENETEATLAWEGIEPGHGIVALDMEWANMHGLPRTAKLDDDNEPEKVIYGIAAYHAIHCLKTIRRHYFNLKNDEPLDRPLEHDMHCFDALRQHIMCAADDTLLAWTGPSDLGRNQMRTCRNWDSLRDWATQNTACYRDWEPPPGESRWGHCDGGG